ncbi:MAG: hypothetical protein QOI78_214 [Actinomycetota bacterium]|jgi:hypothetical protein|nr:hypothetical protein [Actinomycetota bacterium]
MAKHKTIPRQGKINLSHGCATLSDTNARAYFESALVGDPVIVTASAVKMSDTSRDYFDWAVTWDAWRAKSALL